MKKTMIAVALTGLMLNSTFTGVEIANSLVKTNDINPSINPDKITQFAQQTALIPKSLIVGKRFQFSTNQLLKDMNQQMSGSIQWNFPDSNTGANGFINNLTTKLDYESTANIQANFTNNGENQAKIDQINQKINQFSQIHGYISNQKLHQYFDNQFLAQPAIHNVLNAFLATAKKNMPSVVNALQYTKYLGIAQTAISEIVTEWDQQSKWGATPQVAIENYMADTHTDGRLSQAKALNKWKIVSSRAKSWTWNDFYQYIAGVNFNYLIKELTNGKYMGDLITQNIVQKWFHLPSFNQDQFIKDISAALSKLPDTPTAWKYLVAAIVPILKANPGLLGLKEPTEAIASLSWKQVENTNNVAIEPFFEKIIQLLNPNNKDQLVKIIASLLSGESKFAEDIIIDAPVIGQSTLPSLLSNSLLTWFVKSLKPTVIADSLATKIYEQANKINLKSKLEDGYNFIAENLKYNPVIDLKDFNQYFAQVFSQKFTTAIQQLQDAINHPKTSAYSAKTILEILGVQAKRATFKTDSPLFALRAWLDKPNSSFNQILQIANNEHNGIIPSYITNLKNNLITNYQKYFDLSNTTFFQISNVELINHPNSGRNQYFLTYDLTDNTNQQKYHLSFVAATLESPHFRLNQFHQIK